MTVPYQSADGSDDDNDHCFGGQRVSSGVFVVVRGGGPCV